jgi:uncharacterized protein
MVLAGLGYVFDIFSENIFRQLLVVSPLILLSAASVWLGVRLLRRRVKDTRRFIGWHILVTLAAYAVFILLTSLLNVTETSFGSAQPVIIVFGVLYLLSLGVGLIGAAILLNFKGLQKRKAGIIGLFSFVQVSILGLIFYGYYLEPFWIDVTNTTIKEAKLPAGTPALKIVLISDIHMERYTRREDEVLAKIKAIDPDLVVISGDHMSIDFYDEKSYADLRRFFMGLKAKYGVFAVSGVVDNLADTYKTAEGTPVRLLHNETVTLSIHGQLIDLIAVKSSRLGNGDLLRELAAKSPNDRLKLFLYHTPEEADAAASAGIDLYLAGHTHGGQIALPFFGAIFTASSTGLKYKAGLYNLGGTADSFMYITRGLGFEGNNTPRARLFARPEISVLNLVPAQ